MNTKNSMAGLDPLRSLTLSKIDKGETKHLHLGQHCDLLSSRSGGGSKDNLIKVRVRSEEEHDETLLLIKPECLGQYCHQGQESALEQRSRLEMEFSYLWLIVMTHDSLKGI